MHTDVTYIHTSMCATCHDPRHTLSSSSSSSTAAAAAAAAAKAAAAVIVIAAVVRQQTLRARADDATSE